MYMYYNDTLLTHFCKTRVVMNYNIHVYVHVHVYYKVTNYMYS